MGFAVAVIPPIMQEAGRVDHYRLIRMPPKISSGGAGLRNRLLTIEYSLVVAFGGIPAPPMPVGSLRMPQVAYCLSNRLLTEAKTSKCSKGSNAVCRPTTA